MKAEFSTDKPIYRQILDYCLERISSGEWIPEGRIPSVKELSVTMTVNPRTVMRAYEELSEKLIIFQRRGMGFFVSADGPKIVAGIQKTEFEEKTLPEFIALMRRADFPVERVIERLMELKKTKP